jgi:hypothetical protein
MHKCEFCDKEFTQKSNLNYHQKKAKYCLEKRGLRPELVFCVECNFGFVTKRQLDKHLPECTLKLIRKEREIKKEKDAEISLLKEMYEKQIASLEKLVVVGINKRTNKFNLTNINIEKLSQEIFDKNKDLIKREHMEGGVESLTSFLYHQNLKGRAICSDTSRNTIRYIDEEGKHVIDKRCLNVLKKFSKSIQQPSEKIFKEMRDGAIVDTTQFIGHTQFIDNLNKISFLENGINSLCVGKTNHSLVHVMGNNLSILLPRE